MEGSQDHLQVVFCDFTKSTTDLTIVESLGQIRLGRTINCNVGHNLLLSDKLAFTFKLKSENGTLGRIGHRAQ